MSRAERARIRAASYNVHSWKGADLALDPERIFGVIESLNADVIALQEVTSPQQAGAPCSLRELGDCLGYHATFGQTLLREDVRYGNALLSRREPVHVERHDLSRPGREPRGAIEAFFDFDGTTVKTVSTHLGLSRGERTAQLETLLPVLTAPDSDATVFLGDLNDWFPWSAARRTVRTLFGPQPTPRTFPAGRPVFALDRIHVLPAERLLSLKTVKQGAARAASDHLPLLAEIDIS